MCSDPCYPCPEPGLIPAVWSAGVYPSVPAVSPDHAAGSVVLCCVVAYPYNSPMFFSIVIAIANCVCNVIGYSVATLSRSPAPSKLPQPIFTPQPSPIKPSTAPYFTHPVWHIRQAAPLAYPACRSSDHPHPPSSINPHQPTLLYRHPQHHHAISGRYPYTHSAKTRLGRLHIPMRGASYSSCVHPHC